MRSFFHSAVSVTAVLVGSITAAPLLVSSPAHAQLLGPTPYLSFADSPFNGGSFSYFHLEDFEDLQLNTPGVSVNQGTVINNSNSSGIDSVDADDGGINGSGSNGATIFHPTSMTFSFSAAALGGSLPTHVGIVWTDGTPGGLVSFQAFDQNNVLIGTTSVNLGDSSFFGETAEDRFLGVINAGGISRILITDNESQNNLEVDHLQYGLAGSSAAAPEPATLALLAVGLLPVAGAVIRRRKR